MLERDRTRRWLIDALDAARGRLGFELFAYVVMPDHVHVLVRPGVGGEGPAEVLRAIKQPVARRALAWLRANHPDWLDRLRGERAGQRVRYHFWQPGGGYDRNIDQPATLLTSIEYIHANPVRRGLVASPVDWAWSSARGYAGQGKVVLAMDPLPDRFG